MAKRTVCPRITIHTDYYYRSFLTKTNTTGYFFSVLITLLCIFLPFTSVYSTGYFWAKTAVAHEHPKVQFKNKLYTELLFQDTTNNNLLSYEYSTVQGVLQQAQNAMAPPTIEYVGVDRDQDGVIDQWNITMTVKQPSADLKLEQATMILAFDYQTDEIVKMQMESLAVANIYIPSNSMTVSASKINLRGSLKFKQTAPIYGGMNGGVHNLYNKDFFDQLEYLSADALISEYVSTRNETTSYDFKKQVQYSATDDPLSNIIEIQIIVAIPKSQPVIYVPQAPYVFKMGWVQFFYVALFWYLILEKGLLNYLVTMRVFDCTEVTELNVNNISQEKA